MPSSPEEYTKPEETWPVLADPPNPPSSTPRIINSLPEPATIHPINLVFRSGIFSRIVYIFIKKNA